MNAVLGRRGVVAHRHVPAGPLAQLGDARGELLRLGAVRHPLVAVLEHAVEHLRPDAAHEDRRVRLLDRLRPRPDRRRSHELAVERGLVVRPDLLHGQDALAHEREAPLRVGAVVAHLLAVPAAADAELEAPAGQEVERGDLLGGGDRVALDDQADAGARAAASSWPARRWPAPRTGRACASTSPAARRRAGSACRGRPGCACARRRAASRSRRPRPPARAPRARSSSRSGMSSARTARWWSLRGNVYGLR